ncbi:hypothetical protein L1987_13113 [Smallanthus sonchifolius]|uniref:Uncharacterized protein n=1 Tax=Smallanthus sonchifolius TaxID=185202 RepID=A0ACB9JGM9_9ASTR|nr:hypothetical protein L1987_13113 [Smallanthus sonchifolius]
MEWDWKMKTWTTDVTPFLLFESSADSDDVITDVRQEHEKEQEAMDDDAESCCYDHSFQVNVKTHVNHHQDHGDDDNGHDHAHNYHCYDDDVDDDDDDDKNWGDSKMIGHEKRCHEVCVDSSNLDDRNFWETCLAS